LITAEQISHSKWKLTKEGEDFIKNGSYEARIFKDITPEGIAQPDLVV